MALVLSSFGKLLLIAMVIWDYNELEYSWLVNLLVLTSNLEALSATIVKRKEEKKDNTRRKRGVSVVQHPVWQSVH
ncbi:hypothetical protein HDV05_008043 [Chytridiales sp. JEL 0842]|nr:hypothetical protein HDV05_008043 [Chytridiales sp. JEL 0842]